MSRPFWKLRGEDLLVGAAGFPHAGWLPEGQVRQRLRDGGGEAPWVTGLGGDPTSEVQLLQAPHRARSGLLWGLAQLLRAQPRNGIVRDTRPRLQRVVTWHRGMWPPMLRPRPQHPDWEAQGEMPLHLPLVLLRQLPGVCACLWCTHMQIRGLYFKANWLLDLLLTPVSCTTSLQTQTHSAYRSITHSDTNLGCNVRSQARVRYNNKNRA